MREKPKVYHEVIKPIHNNMDFYMEDKNNIDDVRKTINEIFRSKNFWYFKDVRIKIDNIYYDKKIIGVVNDNIVSIDREYIPINKISDIIIK